MQNSFFDHEDYRPIIKTFLKRGQQKTLAEFLGVEPPYLSQVLNTSQNFSMEHGISICQFLSLNEEETHFFLLLLQKERAGSEVLKKHFLHQIYEMKTQSSKVSSKVKMAHELTDDVKAEYYSHWKYSVVFVLTSILGKDLNEIARVLHLPKREVRNVIDFLYKHSLILEKDGGLSTNFKRVFIPTGHRLSLSHHVNFRQLAIAHLNCYQAESLHYSNVMAISKVDEVVIRKILLDTIVEIQKIITESPEEKVSVINIDLFGISGAN